MKNRVIPTILLVIVLSACSSFLTPGVLSTPVQVTAEVGTVLPEMVGPPPTEGPTPTPVPSTQIPTLPAGSSPSELKYRVLEEFPDFFFCDPDIYPVAREEEMVLAEERFPELQADQDQFEAILSHNELSGLTSFSDEHKLLIYREYKKLNAIPFQLVDGRYQFQIQIGEEGQEGSVITATIDGNGSIDVLQRETGFPSCPICLAAGTLIDTPRGAVRVEEIRVGDPVWSVNETGRRVAVSIDRIGSVKVPSTYRLVHLLLEDGRELWASPGHPTATGLRLDDLQMGDRLDGARILLLEHIPYNEMYTYDILPSGATSFYWANEILLGSTLAKP
jgi:hypothetical protein